MKRKPWMVRPHKWEFVPRLAGDLDEAAAMAERIADASGEPVDVCWAPEGNPLLVERRVEPKAKAVDAP